MIGFANRFVAVLFLVLAIKTDEPLAALLFMITVALFIPWQVKQ